MFTRLLNAIFVRKSITNYRVIHKYENISPFGSSAGEGYNESTGDRPGLTFASPDKRTAYANARSTGRADDGDDETRNGDVARARP